VLEEYGDAVEHRLAELGEFIGLPGTSDHAMAQDFIGAIRELAASIGIPAALSQISEEDIPLLAANADKEGNPACPAPIIWHYSVFQKILRRAASTPTTADEVVSNTISADESETPNERATEISSDNPTGLTSPTLRQTRITKPGPLLDEDGRLCALGYATQPLLEYNRRLIKSSVLRIKEWDYYLVNDDSYALALTVGDMGYVALVSASLLDFKRKTFTTQSTMDLLPLGRLGLPHSSDAGVTDYADKRASMKFETACGLRRLKVSFSDFQEGAQLDAEVVLDNEPRDSMVIATPWAESATAFYYNRKIIGMHAVGSFTLGKKRHDFREGVSFGLLDWGRGVWTHDNTWYWSAAQGRQGERLVGFNLGYGFGDTSAATENMLFVDGVAHKLGQVDFGIPIRREKARAIGDRFDLMKPWHFVDDEGRLDLVFSPEIDRCDRMDFKVVVSDQHQVFGRFDGTAVLDDGSTLEISNLRGFAEAVHNVY